MRALLDRIDAVSYATLLAWMIGVTLALHAEQVCEWWGRMRKRTSRANGLPAPIPTDATELRAAVADTKILALHRGINTCARMGTRNARTRRTTRTSAVRVLALRNTSGSRG